ncbi:MAG: ABC transporter permease [Actinomycetota bacterium]|nr:ABC transporter permease [Actinomycetota bacterium]
MPETDVVDPHVIDQQLAGLDALELADTDHRSRAARIWSAAWPKVAAISIAILIWQIVVWSGWKPDYILPGPGRVFGELWRLLSSGEFTRSEVLPATLTRAVTGFLIAVVVGTALGAAMSRVKVLRTAVASLVTGLQTMPSIVWFPMALVLFGLNEKAITFVVVIGAAPSIATGILSGADQVPTVLLRAGRVLGAKGFRLWREVVLPASLPSIVGGLKQGWAFSWRSLMAGELIGAAVGKPGIGGYLDNQRTLGDYPGLYATMILILIIGLFVDSAFGAVEKSIRRRRGLLDAGI